MLSEIKIESKENIQIKTLKKLANKKYRHQNGKFFVENPKIIHDGLLAGYDFETLFVTTHYKSKYADDYNFLSNRSKSAQICIIDEKLNKFFSELDSPSGIAAIYPILPQELDKNQSVVYLNAVNDPGNLGTIMRTMLAFNFHNLVIDETCADIYNAKTISAAKDAIFKIKIHKDKNCQWLKDQQNRLAIYASNAHEGLSLDKFKAAKNFCLVIGSEAHGVSPEIMELSQKNIRIDISNGIESLNAAIATAILLYKLR